MRPLARLLAAAGVLALLSATAAPALAAAPVLPSQDPFYVYAGATPLADVAPGTVLGTRPVTLGAGTTGTPLPATQLLYRTADEKGHPSVTVTTVVVPPGSTVAPKLVAYLSFYDSLSGRCDPSYTLQGGDPGAANGTLTQVEQGLVQTYAAAGYVVTVPDFEGTGLHWTAGHEAGYGTLDAVRATESFLAVPATTPVGLTGYSGGSIAADWASELAPAYSPELTIVGVAEAGIPVDFAHNLTYIDGSAVWSGIIPAVLVALSRAYGLDLDTYLSPRGRALARRVQDQCIGDFSGSTPGLTVSQLLRPQYADLLRQPAFVDIINQLIMGTAPGHPRGPLLMQVGNDPGNAQGQGDDVMVTADVEALAHEYCSQGVTVEYDVLGRSTHEQASVEFEPQALAFLAGRFTGAPFAGNCASVGPGNDISPIRLTAATASPTPSRTPARTGTPARPAAAAPARDTLPRTGAGGLLPLAALGLVAAATAVRVARR